jgi:hypothetical protein
MGDVAISLPFPTPSGIATGLTPLAMTDEYNSWASASPTKCGDEF